MKKIVLMVLSTVVLSGFSQDAKTWRLGVQIGSQASHTRFTGGMSDANARFHHNAFGGGAINFIARYDLNNHWMFMSGLGINSFGFEYNISENYSFLNNHGMMGKYTSVRSSFSALEIPAMAFYKFNPNCKNARWLVGAGFTASFVGAQTNGGSAAKSTDGSSAVNYLSTTSSANAGNYLYFRWSVARERVFKKGNILNVSVLFNWGANTLANSTVNYTIDNKDYNHSFSNNGNFAGIRLAYFFRPLNDPLKNTKATVTK